MSRLLKRPLQVIDTAIQGKFEKFNLSENPFPSNPFVDKESTDKRISGNIYEVAIREKEYAHIESHFLKQPQANPNHLRLGYIRDDSYVGRGNGKSAFLIHLQQVINKEYCLDISDGQNKCFAVYMTPEAGGRSKTFASFVDLLFSAVLRSSIINDCLTILRLEAISELYPSIDLTSELEDENAFKEKLNSPVWFEENNVDLSSVTERIYGNDHLQHLPQYFPIFKSRGALIRHFVTQDDFKQYYLELKKGKERYDFVFSHLISFFQAAAFNGAYILVDNFELVPDFQSARQKRDFALELRSCLFDGLYTNARIGFFSFFLVLHAGVERLINEAWAQSGMENRAPISPQVDSKHVISFEKLSPTHASLLLKKYLSEYRIRPASGSDLFPFTEAAVRIIGETSEYNAAKILKAAYELLNKASDIDGQVQIDEDFVNSNKGVQEGASEKGVSSIENVEPEDLVKKALNQD